MCCTGEPLVEDDKMGVVVGGVAERNMANVSEGK